MLEVNTAQIYNKLYNETKSYPIYRIGSDNPENKINDICPGRFFNVYHNFLSLIFHPNDYFCAEDGQPIEFVEEIDLEKLTKDELLDLLLED